MAGTIPLKCKDCTNWYGAENEESGPCMIKNMRGDARYITQGHHDCDEGLIYNDDGGGLGDGG